MDTAFIGATFDIVGKIMISYAALRVHYRFRKEHAVDPVVFVVMRNEQYIGVIGIIFMILGYLIHYIV